MRLAKSHRFLLLLSLLAASCATLTPLPKPRNEVPALSAAGVARVVVIVLENGDPREAERQPFMRARAAEGTVFTSYFGVAHPSQPNYIAMISGSTADATDNDPVTLDRPHIGNVLGDRWRVYADDYPALDGRCNLIVKKDLYVRRHVPFLSFADVQRGTCSQVVRLNTAEDPVRALRSDIEQNTLPAFALIVPNLQHDGHAPFTMKDANDWLAANIEPLLGVPAFTKDTVFVLTFDEDHTRNAHSNRVYTVIWGDHVRQGTNDDVYNHYDLLATIAALLGVTPPTFQEPGVRPIGGIWR